ncbi:zinc finger, C2H2 type protein [Rhizoctonia solani AG-3 Rhs1AP]|uniref:Zinc finger, C2H2 type protein n=2 Tax=Rhizoctonia solani AG-3 TaxID=1086053 RepID=A0A074RRZ7_9AGAM|nr:zinc finger, C2H2 type protein [Rhizoctonia solani AG-3 Rhs1AP]KEP47468.1 zinc finger, C2H2 type protein [Rhizoctonia solani 123E]
MSAFELSDLRTSLPSDEPRRMRTPVFRSPRSTPLPLSRPMSPAIQLSPHMRPLTHRLRTLAVTVGEDRVMDDTRDGTPSIKSEPGTDSVPSSPRSKGISETDLVSHDEVDIQTGEQRDEQMTCTPTQPDPKLPLPWMETEPTTPTNRHSPLVHSPSPDEDSKSGIVKQSDSETEEETTVQTRSGRSQFDWFMPDGFSPVPLPEITQLQQQAERYGFKLQPDPERQPTNSQSQLLFQMAERQSCIERLQREQEEAATKYRMGLSPATPTTWDQPFGGLSMPELAPPILPSALNFSPTPGPQPIPYIPDPLEYSFPSSSGGGYTDLTPTGLTDYPGLSPPGLTAASSATSASSPSDSFYLASPTPPSLASHIVPARAFKLQDPMVGFKQDGMAFKLQDPMAFKPQDPMAFKLQDTLGFRPQEVIPEEEFGPGSSTGVIPTTGSGTHKCHSCGKTFRRPSGLKDHMNIHSGEKRESHPMT